MKLWMLGYGQSTGGIVPSRGRDATCLARGILQEPHGSGKRIVWRAGRCVAVIERLRVWSPGITTVLTVLRHLGEPTH
jgi:hypothetical protein